MELQSIPWRSSPPPPPPTAAAATTTTTTHGPTSATSNEQTTAHGRHQFSIAQSRQQSQLDTGSSHEQSAATAHDPSTTTNDFGK